MLRRLGVALALLFAVAGCASVNNKPNADPSEIAAVSYRNAPETAITLYTMVNNQTGRGAHTSMQIDASESVIFDPAGSFKADVVPERNDVLFGIRPAVQRAYIGAHARETHHVVIQRIVVSPEQAERAYQLALAAGPVPNAFCASATSRLLAQVPGFENIRSVMYPVRLKEQFEDIPGVVTTAYYEDDAGGIDEGVARSNDALNQSAVSQDEG